MNEKKEEVLQTEPPKAPNEKKNKRSKILIVLLIVISLFAIGIAVWALFFRTPPKTAADYAPQQIETNAEPVSGDDTDKMSSPQGGGAVSLTYSNTVTLSLSSKEADLVFQNPTKSNQDMVLELLIDGKVIAKSGRLPAGYGLKKLTGVDTEMLKEGTYNGKFTVLYYNTQSGEKAMVNTDIPVTITVQK
jgi:flagellar basal body-associated protein FliL